ncbi:hypothetical protein ABES80_05180 [Bacillus gobiensis]
MEAAVIVNAIAAYFFIIKNASAANDGYIAYMAGKIEFALAVVSIHM